MVKIETTEEFKKEVYDLVGDEYLVLGEYVNKGTKIEIKHNVTKCNHIYDVTPHNFLAGRRCPKCFGTPKKTTEQFKKEVYNLVGEEYVVLGEYETANKHIKMKHNIRNCNHIYEVKPSNFLNMNNRCPKCSGVQRKTTKQFKQEIHDLVEDEYVVLGKYINNNTRIKMKHNTKFCQHLYNASPAKFLSGARCPKCTKKINRDKLARTTKEFKQEVCDLVGDEYTVLGEYTNNNTTIKMKHNKELCQYIYEITPGNFLKGVRCSKCAGLKKKTTEEFKQEVYNLEKDEYAVLSEYIGANKNIKMKHNIEKCKHIYNVNPSSFLRNSRCPKCNESKGEKLISNLLSKYNISYIIQYKFEDCKYKKTLPFDFVVLDNQGILRFLIEYDGKQHYKSIKYFGGKKNLKIVKKRDKIKTEYCRENNISLIRIPYWEFENIEKIILKKLHRENLI